MTATITDNSFVQRALKTHAVTEQHLRSRFPDLSRLPTDAKACAAALVESGLLTPYQSKQLLIGKVTTFMIGPYKLLQPIGKGGMGLVYLADHSAMNRKVALKVLPADQAKNPIYLERFYREARSAASLDHPNIMRLYDVNQIGKLHYLVMEYIEGVDLQTRLTTQGPMTLPEAADVIAQVAIGLQHAFEKGFVHRDIKPANLMIGKDGIVKILDMGLARSIIDPEQQITEQLEEEVGLIGTVDFVSPEQAQGQSVDIRADIYSLGGTFYTLLTNKLPYTGTTTNKLLKHQTAPPPKATLERPDLPPEIDDILAKMMAKKPEDRFAMPNDVVVALNPWLTERRRSGIVSLSAVFGPLSGKSGSSGANFDNTPTKPNSQSPFSAKANPKPARSRAFFGIVVSVLLTLTIIGVFVIIAQELYRKETQADITRKSLDANQKQDTERESRGKTDLIEKKLFGLHLASMPVLTTDQPFYHKILTADVSLSVPQVPLCFFCPRHEDHPGTKIEFAVQNVDGRMQMSMAKWGGTGAVEIQLMENLPVIETGKSYCIRLEYKTEGPTRGELELRRKSDKQGWINPPQRWPIAPAEGNWSSVDFPFTSPERYELQMVFKNYSPVLDRSAIYFRTIEVIEFP